MSAGESEISFDDHYPGDLFMPRFRGDEEGDIHFTRNGNWLWVNSGPNTVVVADPREIDENGGYPYRFCAHVATNGIANFTIYRRKLPGPGPAHPDIHPVALSKAALAFFVRTGREPTMIHDMWPAGKTNLSRYQYDAALQSKELQSLTESDRNRIAAESTWTAGIARQLGYSRLLLVESFPGNDEVEVYFGKPESQMGIEI